MTPRHVAPQTDAAADGDDVHNLIHRDIRALRAPESSATLSHSFIGFHRFSFIRFTFFSLFFFCFLRSTRPKLEASKKKKRKKSGVWFHVHMVDGG